MNPFEIIVREAENAGYHHFLFFPHNVFYPFQDKFGFTVTFILLSANAFNLD